MHQINEFIFKMYKIFFRGGMPPDPPRDAKLHQQKGAVPPNYGGVIRTLIISELVAFWPQGCYKFYTPPDTTVFIFPDSV